MGIFKQKDIDELKRLYQEILEKSDWNQSARGAHYSAYAWLKKHGINRVFPNMRTMEDYISHIVIYNEVPEDTE